MADLPQGLELSAGWYLTQLQQLRVDMPKGQLLVRRNHF